MPPFPQWITGGVMRCDGLLKPHAFFWGFYPSIVIMGRIFSSVGCFKQETVVCNRNSREETRAISACLSYSLAVWFRVNYQVPATPFIYVGSRNSDADSAEPLRGIMWWSLGPYFGSPANKSLLLDRWVKDLWLQMNLQTAVVQHQVWPQVLHQLLRLGRTQRTRILVCFRIPLCFLFIMCGLFFSPGRDRIIFYLYKSQWSGTHSVANLSLVLRKESRVYSNISGNSHIV